MPGDHSGEVTPVPIPNTEVKLPCADGTARETVWESKSSPGFFYSYILLYKNILIINDEVHSRLNAYFNGIYNQRLAIKSKPSFIIPVGRDDIR